MPSLSNAPSEQDPMHVFESPRTLWLMYFFAALSWLLLSAGIGLSNDVTEWYWLSSGALLLCLSAASLWVALRKNNRTKLREERLLLAMDSAQEGVWDWDIIRNTVFFSQRYCAMVGETQESFGNTIEHWRARVHPDDKDIANARLRPVIAGEATYYDNVHRMLHSDGSYRWIHSRGQILLNAQGKPARVIGTSVDITQKREDGIRLRQASAVFDSTREGVLVTNNLKQIVHINLAFSRITGYSADEVLGRNPAMFKSGRHDRRFYETVWGSIQKTGTWSGEIWNRRKNGEIFPMWQTIRQVNDENGIPSHYVAVFSDISAIKESQNEIDFLAHHDPLTGLPNRLVFGERIAQASQRPYASAVILIDLDHFGTVNEGLDHSVGDLLLKAVGERIQSLLDKTSTLARLGGDEFGVLYEECTQADQASHLAQKLLAAFEEPFVLNEQPLFVTASLGISLMPDDGNDVDTLIRNADSALYRSKQNGRNTFTFYSESMTQEARERVRLEGELRRAIEHNELRVHFQPILRLHDQKLLGAEALVRWQHPEMGMVPPGQFIPFAEESGLIAAIDMWVLENTCTQLKAWLEQDLPIEFVAVNLSSRLFARGELVEQIRTILERTGLDPKYLELEVTEGAIMQSVEQTCDQLNQLRALGLKLAIDDFGTGYSSLSRLKKLPLDKLKIDQSFVRGLPDDENDVAITSAVIHLGQSLGLRVLAEGIETAEQAAFLEQSGCTLGQGYHFGRPQPAADFVTLLKA